MKVHRVLIAALFLAMAVGVWALNLKKFKAPSRKFQQKTPVAVAGVRGLDEPGATGDLSARDAAAVAWLEAVKTTPAEFKKFIDEGRLKP